MNFITMTGIPENRIGDEREVCINLDNVAYYYPTTGKVNVEEKEDDVWCLCIGFVGGNELLLWTADKITAETKKIEIDNSIEAITIKETASEVVEEEI